MPANARPYAILLLSLAGLVTGCHTEPKLVDRYDENGAQGKVAVMPSDLVVLDLPMVRAAKGVITISGTVHRKSGGTGTLPGRVDIEFLGPGGEYLDGLPALLTPRAVPADPGTPATYSTSYGYVPPVGSTVRVHFVDQDTQVREDLEGANDYSYAGNGGKGNKAGGELPNPNGTKRGAANTGGGSFGGGFGSHRY